MRQILLLLTSVFLLTGCRKDINEPALTPAKDFSLGYYFVNHGDGNIKTVYLDSKTFFPEKKGPGNNIQNNYYNTYENIGPNQTITHISDAAWMEKTLYPGCLTYMTVVIQFNHAVYTAFPATAPSSVPPGGYQLRKFEMTVDTVTAAAKCERVFNWPADTLKYRELRYYR